MLSGRAEYQDKAKPKPWKGFTIHRKARNSNAFPALVAALIAYIEVWQGRSPFPIGFGHAQLALGRWGGARLSTHRVGLSNFSAKNTPVPPWIPFRPPRIPPVPPRIPTVSPREPLSSHEPASSRDTARPFRGPSEPLQFSFRPSFAAFSLTFHTASVSLSVRAGEYFILDNYRMSMG